ncbi:MAG: TonB-dependent receptor, partial [Candidatus Solibacter sp.]|nr:TonB-dependent receptor [Candidatus Solibacter sp.]
MRIRTGVGLPGRRRILRNPGHARANGADPGHLGSCQQPGKRNHRDGATASRCFRNFMLRSTCTHVPDRLNGFRYPLSADRRFRFFCVISLRPVAAGELLRPEGYTCVQAIFGNGGNMRTFLSILALLCVSLTPMAGQTVGEITGEVKDTSGANAPNAAVTATNIETNVARSTLTNSSGVYSLPGLAPGIYHVKAT